MVEYSTYKEFILVQGVPDGAVQYFFDRGVGWPSSSDVDGLGRQIAYFHKQKNYDKEILLTTRKPMSNFTDTHLGTPTVRVTLPLNPEELIALTKVVLGELGKNQPV